MFRAAIFDGDGVLVDSPHQKAWRESLRQLMESDWAGSRDHTMLEDATAGVQAAAALAEGQLATRNA
jgi:phosphoglycolate phosphatase-like HAD superfamily hydrolase